jgi:murein DD-endopeptidase MepM/ murein hydrolase activator NlpD
MFALVRALIRRPQEPRTVIVVGDDGTEPPRQYRLRPREALLKGAFSVIGLAVLLTAMLLLSPLRTVFLGPDPEELRETARMTAIRAAALSDSLSIQREYLDVLRATLTGNPETSAARIAEGQGAPVHSEVPLLEWPEVDRTSDWADHESPAIPFSSLDASPSATLTGAADAFLATLQFPALPPLEGFLARGYEAARGHFGIDIAVAEDTPVRAIGDGYVIFADWTNDGGYVVAVQHADGFLSVYKHNRRLLKRVGDQVRNRETVALSGNTGEITTGPHLHFELWRNGLAQDPRLYLVGL